MRGSYAPSAVRANRNAASAVEAVVVNSASSATANGSKKRKLNAPDMQIDPAIKVPIIFEDLSLATSLFDPARDVGTSDSEDEDFNVHHTTGRTARIICLPDEEDESTQLDTQLNTSLADDDGEIEASKDGDKDEGEEDLNRAEPDVWDHVQELELDFNADSGRDEVVRMLEAIKAAKDGKLIAALFAMSCTIVFDSVSTTMGVMGGTDVRLAAATTFADHMLTFPMKAYARDNLLVNFPGHTWPASYVNYINALKAKVPTAKALATAMYNGVPPELRGAVMFGNTIKAKSLKTKAFVNMHLVPNYRPEEDLTSGHTREQQLRAQRCALWPLEASTRAHGAVRTAVSRHKTLFPKGPPMPEAQSKALYLAARLRTYRKLTHRYYPPEFLVFVLFSVAAEDPSQILASINGGMVATVITNPTSTAPVQDLSAESSNSPGHVIAAMRRGGRQVRRRAEVLAAHGAQEGAAPAPAPTVNVVHTHVIEQSALDKRAKALERLIDIVTRSNRIAEDEKVVRIAEYESELMDVLEEIRRA